MLVKLLSLVLLSAQPGVEESRWISDLAHTPRAQRATARWTELLRSAGQQNHASSSPTNPTKTSPRGRSEGVRSATFILGGRTSNYTQSPAVVILEGREIDTHSIRALTQKGNLRSALADSNTLYVTWPDRIDVVLERARVLVAAGQFGQAFDIIVPHAVDRAMPEVLLFACLTSSHLGNALGGEQRYCSDQIASYSGPLAEDYLADLQASPRSTETLAWIALGCEYQSHGSPLEAYWFYREALRRDPTDPLAAGCCITLDTLKLFSGLERARWLAPILHGALPRSKGHLHDRIVEELRAIDYIVRTNR
jgi:hypothetical protein